MLKNLLLVLFGIVLFSSCSKDDDSLENERIKVEDFVKQYKLDQIMANDPNNMIESYSPISFTKYERLEQPFHECRLYNAYLESLKKGTISQKSFEEKVSNLQAHYTRIMYYVTYVYSIKLKGMDASKWSRNYVINEKMDVVYDLGQEIE